MLMSCAALLRRHEGKGTKLGADEVRDAISGNLCRCGTYPHVVAAVLGTARETASKGKEA
jgi:aerobic-type carbon monoxide dehydrogenase small subunit (CoxS/CutS family)